jgi:hypothetical protein
MPLQVAIGDEQVLVAVIVDIGPENSAGIGIAVLDGHARHTPEVAIVVAVDEQLLAWLQRGSTGGEVEVAIDIDVDPARREIATGRLRRIAERLAREAPAAEIAQEDVGLVVLSADERIEIAVVVDIAARAAGIGSIGSGERRVRQLQPRMLTFASSSLA